MSNADMAGAPNSLEINGVRYVRADAARGKRAVVVVDRGWIYAGDVTEHDGRIYLDRAVWVFRWESIGFDGVLSNPKSPKATIRPLAHRVDIPAASEVFRIPVADEWGM